MLNTVAFIESIEPDFEYQGLEGAMSLVVENAENFAIINDVIDESAEIAEEEAFTEGVIGSAAKFVRKAIEWIIKNIKKAIAKLKSLFLSLVHKLKMAYLSAMRSIGKFAAKNLTSKSAGTVKVKWYKLKEDQFKTLAEGLTEKMVGAAEKMQSEVENARFTQKTTLSASDDQVTGARNIIYDSEHMKTAKTIKKMVKELTTGKDKKVGGEMFTYETTASANTSSVKSLYEKSLVKGVNSAYKKMMKANNHLLKAAAKTEKSIDKYVRGETNFGKKDSKTGEGKKHISTARLMIKTLNAGVNMIITTNSVIFSALYKTAVFALHQNIKATVYAMKRAAMGDDAFEGKKGSKEERDKRGDAFQKDYYGESSELEIDDILA